MRTTILERGRPAACQELPSCGACHPQAQGAGGARPAVRRLKAIACVALLLAVVPAATCIATGWAGVPVLFSTVCDVVSCAALAGNFPGG